MWSFTTTLFIFFAMDISLSVLDLAPIPSGSAGSETLVQTTKLARMADQVGYARYWFAEHHNMPSIASSAPEVLIAHAASATKRIRVGAGGIMLPNHVPLKVAETFHTLEALYPNRIDLGIGRAPGTNAITSRALRAFDAEKFPTQLKELLALSRGDFPEDHPFHSVEVIPNDVVLPPVWILGSSGNSAEFAGSMGMGYGFARHFSHSPIEPALAAYRKSFRPSDQFQKPHVILALTVICAETEKQANHLSASMDLSWVRLKKREHAPLPSPEEAKAYEYSASEQAIADKYRSLYIVGTPEKVRAEIEALVKKTKADEVMVSSLIHSYKERMRSYKLVAEAFDLPGAEVQKASSL